MQTDPVEKKKDRLYFLALILPAEVTREVILVQKQMASDYHSRRALRVMPHITLKAPFLLEDRWKHGIVAWFNQLTIRQTDFEIVLDGYGCFPNKKSPVIFIKPQPSLHLHQLQSDLLNQFQEAFPHYSILSVERDFAPHVTVAYRDLSPENFVHAWKVFQSQSFYASFNVKEVYLLEHNGTQWVSIAARSLSAIP